MFAENQTVSEDLDKKTPLQFDLGMHRVLWLPGIVVIRIARCPIYAVISAIQFHITSLLNPIQLQNSGLHDLKSTG